MQKIINVLALSSFVVSLTVVGTAGYVYVRKDAIIENIKEKALGSLTGSITDALPDITAGQMPKVTGNAIPALPGNVPGLGL
tara:strand:+ start:854 stop:1099 length:246 start_codon:yes stop_codon:yes gene_type:complete